MNAYELMQPPPIDLPQCNLCLKWFDLEICVLKEEHQEWFLHPHCLGKLVKFGVVETDAR